MNLLYRYSLWLIYRLVLMWGLSRPCHDVCHGGVCVYRISCRAYNACRASCAFSSACHVSSSACRAFSSACRVCSVYSIRCRSVNDGDKGGSCVSDISHICCEHILCRASLSDGKGNTTRRIFSIVWRRACVLAACCGNATRKRQCLDSYLCH